MRRYAGEIDPPPHELEILDLCRVWNMSPVDYYQLDAELIAYMSVYHEAGDEFTKYKTRLNDESN